MRFQHQMAERLLWPLCGSSRSGRRRGLTSSLQENRASVMKAADRGMARRKCYNTLGGLPRVGGGGVKKYWKRRVCSVDLGQGNETSSFFFIRGWDFLETHQSRRLNGTSVPAATRLTFTSASSLPPPACLHESLSGPVEY